MRRNEGGMRDSSNEMNQKRKCFRCGNTGHIKAQCRWAQGTCFSCGKAGHLGRECRDPEVPGYRRCGADCPKA